MKMKNVLIALGFTLAASTAAFADSGALDVQQAPAAITAGAVAAPIATNGPANAYEQRARLGDGSPVYQQPAGIDYTATASVSDLQNAPRLGDGSPVFFN
jgi:hypothetical protein